MTYYELLEKLLGSLNGLSENLQTSADKTENPIILQRLLCYKQMVEEAKLVAYDMYSVIDLHDSDYHIAQKLKKINAISTLIKDDALQLLAGEQKDFDA